MQFKLSLFMVRSSKINKIWSFHNSNTAAAAVVGFVVVVLSSTLIQQVKYLCKSAFEVQLI
jgi:hypothetical protein